MKIKKEEILSFFLSTPEPYKRAAYIKDAYPHRYTGLMVAGQEVGYLAEPDGLILRRGKYLTRTEESKFSWDIVTELTAQLIQNHEYITTKDIGRLPEESSPQMSFFDAETLNYPTIDPNSQLSFFKGFEISQQVIDEALCLGSNEPNSLERICAHFAKDYPLKENAIFLQQEYGRDGKGFYSGTHPVSVWFDDTGLRIAEGKTSQGLRSVLVPWEDAARRVRALLDMGRFVSQAILDSAEKNERKELSAILWYIVQDFSEEAHNTGYLPTLAGIYGSRGGFPSNTEEISILLQHPESVDTLAEEMANFVKAYRKNASLQRFRRSHCEKALKQLEGLQRQQREFPSQPNFTHEPQQFITGDEIDSLLIGGGNKANFGIYAYYLENHTPQERIKFLKNEYGTGGYSRLGYDENHDSKGIEYSRGKMSAPYDKVLLKWPQVEKRIGELIRLGRYMSQKELEYIPTYERNQLAREIYLFFSNIPADQQRPYPEGADYYKAVPTIEKQLENPEQLAVLIKMMEPVQESTPLLDRHYDARKKAFEDVTAFRKGRYSLFGKKANATAPTNTLPAEEKTPEPEPLSNAYQLDYRYLNDRLMVFNLAGLTPDDLPVVVARLEPDGEVVFLDAVLPDSLKEEIRQAGENDLERYKAEAEAHVEEMLGAALAVAGEPPSEWITEPDSVQKDSPVVVGKQFVHEGRQYEITAVDTVTLGVKLRDDTFMGEVGVPITRVETIPVVEGWLRELEKPEEKPLVPAFAQKTPARAGQLDAFPGVPMARRINYKITNDNLGEGGPKEKFKANMAAIRLLGELTESGLMANPEQQEVLAKYVGWGGLDQAFDETNTSWAQEYRQLKELLSHDEYESARATVLNAHYTSPVVIKAIYKAVENMGFATGNILDPGCGVGNFQGLLPESMADSKVFGVEIDPITGRIARQLYQKSSIAIQGYESTDLPDSFFDLAIGNVPFGNYGVADKRYDKHKFLIHDFFFAKTLDKVRPGGVVAFITSKGTMDKQNPAVRKYLAQRADLLGAIRLPNNAFLANAGTEVTTDIIFLQKRDRIVDVEPSWVHLSQLTVEGEKASVMPINAYFAEDPDMILGEMVLESGPFGPEPTCKPYDDADLGAQLEDAIQNIHAEYIAFERDEENEQADLSIPADPTVRNFSYTLSDGELYYRENSRMVPVELSLTAQNRVKGMIEIRDCMRDLIEFQTEDFPDNAIFSKQKQLNRLYDAFAKKYGLLNSRANSVAFSEDSAYCLLCSLEVLNENGELERKADMFTKRTIKPHIQVLHVDTASEALAVSIGEKACVDIAFMASLTGKTQEQLVQDLTGVIFRVPASVEENDAPIYQTADEYLSGNVREKLATARQYEAKYSEFSVNRKALEKVQPVDLSASEINVRLGSTWIPPETVRQFTFALLSTPNYVQWNTKISYSQYTSEWNISNKNADHGNVKANNTYGTSRVNAYKIIEETLNLRDVRVFDYVEEDGKRKPVLNKKETAIAQSKQELIKSEFTDWIWSEPQRRERLVQLYNERFNSVRPREYDGSHIRFSGISPEIRLHPHQVNAIAHILYGGNTLLAHVVGAGKTFEMVAAAMESKRLGLCSKSMFVVPNHLTEQMVSEFLQLYTSANILVATRKDFETKNRKKFCGRISTGEYDAVIIGHSQFEKVPMSMERQCAMLEREKREILAGIQNLKRSHGERFTIKQLEKMRKSIDLRLEKLNDQSRKDSVVTFEELGIDRIFVDEAHGFKNLYSFTKMRNVAGIAQTEAQKSADLFMKTRYLDELTNGRGVIFATGTPIYTPYPHSKC